MTRLLLRWMVSIATSFVVVSLLYSLFYIPNLNANIESAIEESINPAIEDGAKFEWFASNERAGNATLARRFNINLQASIDLALSEALFPSVSSIRVVSISETNFEQANGDNEELYFSSEVQFGQNQKLPVVYLYKPKPEKLQSSVPLLLLASALLVVLFDTHKNRTNKKIDDDHQNSKAETSLSRDPLRQSLIDIVNTRGFDLDSATTLVDGLGKEWINYLLTTPDSMNETIAELISSRERWGYSAKWYEYFVNSELLSPNRAIRLADGVEDFQLDAFRTLRDSGLSIDEGLTVVKDLQSEESLSKLIPLIVHLHQIQGGDLIETLNAVKRNDVLSLIYAKKSVEIYGQRFTLKPQLFALYYLLVEQKLNGYDQVRIPEGRAALPEFDECLHIYYRKLPRASSSEKRSFDFNSVKNLINQLNHALRTELSISTDDDSIFQDMFVKVIERDSNKYLQVALDRQFCAVHTGNQSNGPGDTQRVKNVMKALGGF
ncbi:MAG: hypothetical protein HWE12_07420 [Oceanospirillaceae bacterium]|nr:hypothetical protein [Oceanospirillaceae bacterium]